MRRIGIDARELSGRPTGVGRYLRELLVRWRASADYAGVDLFVFSPEAGPPAWLSAAGAGAALAWRHVPGTPGTRWEQLTLPGAVHAAGVDAWFAPAYTAPLRLRVPIVVAMHDVSFAAHPEWYAWRHGVRLRSVARWTARRAARVVTLTRFSAGEITRHLGTPAARVQVIPIAVDYLDAPPRPIAPPAAAPHVLFVGSIFERRHLPLLMQGVARARALVPDIRLVVIGENRTATRQDFHALARDLDIEDALQLYDYVTDEALDAAYAGAGVFAFLSEYEGFGLTPLEAMRHRVPAVVLDTPVAREVYGDGAIYVQRDVANIARALVDVLTRPDYRQARIAAGDATVAGYRWEETARATWDVIRAVAEEREP